MYRNNNNKNNNFGTDSLNYNDSVRKGNLNESSEFPDETTANLLKPKETFMSPITAFATSVNVVLATGPFTSKNYFLL
jgi:hypothetical protein